VHNLTPLKRDERNGARVSVQHAFSQAELTVDRSHEISTFQHGLYSVLCLITLA